MELEVAYHQKCYIEGLTTIVGSDDVDVVMEPVMVVRQVDLELQAVRNK